MLVCFLQVLGVDADVAGVEFRQGGAGMRRHVSSPPRLCRDSSTCIQMLHGSSFEGLGLPCAAPLRCARTHRHTPGPSALRRLSQLPAGLEPPRRFLERVSVHYARNMLAGAGALQGPVPLVMGIWGPKVRRRRLPAAANGLCPLPARVLAPCPKLHAWLPGAFGPGWPLPRCPQLCTAVEQQRGVRRTLQARCTAPAPQAARPGPAWVLPQPLPDEASLCNVLGLPAADPALQGVGKTFSLELCLRRMGVTPVCLSAGELEDEWAGEPGRRLRERYAFAGEARRGDQARRQRGGLAVGGGSCTCLPMHLIWQARLPMCAAVPCHPAC